ncbi:MAG: phosphoglycerate kinase [Planctomycetales bacterium]|nr:phosphoglycerate kinase [Planctomycetales bacterium]
MNKLSLNDVELKGRRVLCRVDYNTPLENGAVSDNRRIQASLPTVRHILEHGGRLILMSHLGRPNGERVEKYSLKPVSEELQKLLPGTKVHFATDCIGAEVERQAAELQDGEVLLLENLRFHAGEEANSPEMAKALASLADLYVNDAFGAAHRAHASTAGAPSLFDQAACGFLMEKELTFLGTTVSNPTRPFTAIMGGAKVKDKIPVLENLVPRVDKIIIGGGMAYTFLKSQGHSIGDSLLDKDQLDFCRQLLADHADKIVLPVDIVVTDKLDFDNRTLGETKTVAATAIPDGWEGVDIGPQSVAAFEEVIVGSKTVLWNGPMGVFEIEASSHGTMAVAEAMAKATELGAKTIIGGGDSAAAVKKAKLSDKMTHVSTGGGASLEFLEGQPLPGVTSLTDK